MKKIITFIPLGIGISSAIIYIFNVISFRVINSAYSLMQILSNLKIYLYISIAGFLTYLFIKIILLINDKYKNKDEQESNVNNYDDKYENTVNKTYNQSSYVPDYSYVPIYNENNKLNENLKDEKETVIIKESKINNNNKYCFNCGNEIYEEDKYCRHCGFLQEKVKNKNTTLRKIINILEIVIMILVLYFLINMLFEYKESKDPNFKSPFKVSMTK